VFSARYELSPDIKQAKFVFKGLNYFMSLCNYRNQDVTLRGVNRLWAREAKNRGSVENRLWLLPSFLFRE
jgi:hypothetical protein